MTTLVLDGTPVRVHGEKKLSKKSIEALEALVRAAKKQRPGLRELTVRQPRARR